MHRDETYCNTKLTHKNQKPRLVAFCDLRPGNGMGLFSTKWLNKEVNTQGKKEITKEVKYASKQTKSTKEFRPITALEPSYRALGFRALLLSRANSLKKTPYQDRDLGGKVWRPRPRHCHFTSGRNS